MDDEEEARAELRKKLPNLDELLAGVRARHAAAEGEMRAEAEEHAREHDKILAKSAEAARMRFVK